MDDMTLIVGYQPIASRGSFGRLEMPNRLPRSSCSLADADIISIG